MKQRFVRLLAVSLVTVPAWANAHDGSPGNSSTGSPTVASSSTATANGGAGGAGGTASGGAATGGAATGGAATGGMASGGSSNVSVSLTSGSGSGSGDGSSAANTRANVDYGGSYTVKSAPQIVAPSLTSTFSDTCMGSSSFGLSVVGFGATGGTTIVDEACVRRLDSREFRAMGMTDVALALLCQSAANRKAVESTGRACPSASPAAEPVASASKTTDQITDPFVRRRMGLEQAGGTPAASVTATAVASAVAPAAPAAPSAEAQDSAVAVSAVTRSEPDVQLLKDVATGTGN